MYTRELLLHFQSFRRSPAPVLLLLLALAVLSCGKTRQEIDPSSFASGWVSEQTEHFTVFDPPQSPRRTHLREFGENCEQAYAELARGLKLDLKGRISIYRFITNQDCETATGHAAGRVEGYRIYTRIGAPVGGAIALAAFTSVDPEAQSFELIKDGLREAFDNESANIHGDAAKLKSEGRWQPLSMLLTPESIADHEAYRVESASFVAYLIQVHGIDKFKMLWRSALDLGPSLERIYGGTLQQIEDDWAGHVEREAKKT